MLLESLEIENYKSFWKRERIEFSPGFNLLIGANNSGKTTLLEALHAQPGLNSPHRSYRNLQSYGDQPNGLSEFSTVIQTDLRELRRLANNSLFIPLPENRPESATAAYQKLAQKPGLQLRMHLSGSGQLSTRLESCLGRSVAVPAPENRPVTVLEIQYHDSSSVDPSVHLRTYLNSYGNIPALRDMYYRSFYRFSAHRRPSSECGNAQTAVLDPEASMLPYCINHLQSNDAHAHKILCEWVNRVFPSVRWVQAPHQSNGLFQLQCLPLLPEERRHDLAIPLSHMGTGIGNVIAMLYVVLTARFPQVISIDEPNSFLHPRALRELLQILFSEGSHHQYILSAHSADVLTAAAPNLITLCEFDGASTSVRQVKGHDLAMLREGLSDLGIRMTDLHGRDKVLWVEGQTEELILPEMLRHFCPRYAPGIAVLRVEHTGTFEKKGVDPKEVAQLYKRLSEASALVPPMVAVLLDREFRGLAECERLSLESKGALRFLDQPMIENYFLHAGAVHAILCELGEDIQIERVEQSLQEELQSYGEESPHGAKVLGNLFSKLSASRHEFKKTRDVPKIATWILENDPASLSTMGEFLASLAEAT